MRPCTHKWGMGTPEKYRTPNFPLTMWTAYDKAVEKIDNLKEVGEDVDNSDKTGQLN